MEAINSRFRIYSDTLMKAPYSNILQGVYLLIVNDLLPSGPYFIVVDCSYDELSNSGGTGPLLSLIIVYSCALLIVDTYQIAQTQKIQN